jgi:hypothetical protein
MQSLLETLPDYQPEESTLSKSEFAKQMGVTPGRISQLIAKGLPVLPTGRISPAAARDWYDANVDPSRRRAPPGEEPARLGRPTLKDEIETERLATARMKRLRLEQVLIDRQTAEAAIFARARAERDAHLAWVVRKAPQLAAHVGCEPAAVFSFLDQEMRLHLAALAERPLEALTDA